MDAVRGKTKTKKKKKKGAGNKKRVPTMILRGTMRGLTADEGVDTSIVYNKTVTGGFEVRAADIKTRDSDNLPSYDILYFVPGTNAPVSESGVLCDLGTTQFVFENVCPYTLHVRVQRPMGYKQDCGALAMWEAIGSKVMHAIKPKATLTLTSGNNSTSHMVPREVVEKGGRAVHLATISIFREVFTDFGNLANDLGKETGLTCTVSTRVKTTNGSVGSSNDYIVRLYSGSKRMDHINPMPLPDMRFGDILTSLGAVTSVQSANSGAPTQLRLAFFVGANEAPSVSLDPRTAYRLPTGVPMYVDTAQTKLGIASYLAYYKNEWVVGFFSPKKGVGTFQFYPGVVGSKSSFTVDVSYCPEEWLCPIMGASSKSVVSSKTVSSIMRMSASAKTTLRSEQLDESFLTLLITTVVVIYNVSKVAVETLGAFGVLPAPTKINDAFDMSSLTEIG